MCMASPNLDTYFKVENFAHLDHLKKSVLRAPTTLLNMMFGCRD